MMSPAEPARSRYLAVQRKTPEDAPQCLELSPGTPFGMSLGKRVDPGPIVITYSRLQGIPSAGWVGNIFYMAPRFVEIVRQLGEMRLQEFPITVRDRRGETKIDAIVGVVTLDNVPCLDRTASKFEVDEDDPEEIDEMKSLVLDEARIPADRHLFRVAEFISALIVSRPLAERLTANGITGVRFSEKYR
jgi:hypothetical protein